ncbi:inorganic phosphate transporter [Conexibacter woesei]|uniref:inorganic phosphate transporter n=1 Tax=Conexibacter woesei TaxID=191495 RepID=UPI00047A843D|nr:inorganic phosphate transporter [Conexibacter woesei]
MNDSELLLVVVIVTALAFDFTNGFHDTANAMATSIATRALSPKIAVTLCALLNFAGAFISIKVAATISSGIVDQGVLDLRTLFAALIGAAAWNLATWALGLPSSSSHALIGGLVGAAVVASGWSAVDGNALVEKVIAPAVLSPLICGAVAAIGTFIAYKMQAGGPDRTVRRSYKFGQIGTASLVSLAHGTNDAQKTMGVITLALVAHGSLVQHGDDFSVPLWVKVVAASAIALGSYTGGWRIINTMGRKLTEIEAPQGFVAEATSATTILAASSYGYPLSTTHVVSGGILGVGIGKRLSEVRWGLASRMAAAWVLTLPAAAVVAGIIWTVADGLGGATGPILLAVVAAGGAIALFVATQRGSSAIHASDV